MKRFDSPILTAVAGITFFLVNIFAVHLLLRGHNEPGGGFIAGLATAISLVMLMLALGLERTHRILAVEPVSLAAVGLALATLTALAPLLFGRPFLEHFDTHLDLPLIGDLHLGTPLAFDTGVYLLVVGVTCKMIFMLAKSSQGFRDLMRAEGAKFASPRETPVEEDAPAGLDAHAGKEDGHAA